MLYCLPKPLNQMPAFTLLAKEISRSFKKHATIKLSHSSWWSLERQKRGYISLWDSILFNLGVSGPPKIISTATGEMPGERGNFSKKQCLFSLPRKRAGCFSIPCVPLGPTHREWVINPITANLTTTVVSLPLPDIHNIASFGCKNLGTVKWLISWIIKSHCCICWQWTNNQHFFYIIMTWM